MRFVTPFALLASRFAGLAKNHFPQSIWRVNSVDLLRGGVMAFVLLDHPREFVVEFTKTS